MKGNAVSWRFLVSESFVSLRYYRRRTLITIISLSWGVACFILLMSFGSGFDMAMRSAFSAVGQDLIVTSGGQTSLQAGGLRTGHRIRLEKEDVAILKEQVPLIAGISPEKFAGERTVMRGTREKRYSVRGGNVEYKRIRNMDLTAGRWISEEDLLQRNRVAVLGSTVARELFSGLPAEGEEISIAGMRFRVVGILAVKGQLANYSRTDNDCIFLPYDTMSVFVDTHYPDLVVWSPVSPLVRKQAIKQVRTVLAGLHRFSPADEKAVETIAFNDFLYIIDGMTIALKVLLGFIGALTLGIGGVGLANIMLSAVIDRTREIGVLKALGGRRRAILSQFLIEALMIVGSGGILGTLAGVAAVMFISSMPLLGPLFEDDSGTGDLRLKVSLASVLVSTGVLFAVGLVAGMAPAIKASRYDPIEALRYE